MLTRQGLKELASPNHSAKLIGTAVVTSPSSTDSTQPEQEKESRNKVEIKPEIKIKTEEDILKLPPNVPRKVVNLRDPNVMVIIRHTDGAMCYSKKSYAFYNQKPPPKPHELPDLPDLPDLPNVNAENSMTSRTKSEEKELRELLDLPAPQENPEHNESARIEPAVNSITDVNAENLVDDPTTETNSVDTSVTLSINNEAINGLAENSTTNVNTEKNPNNVKDRPPTTNFDEPGDTGATSSINSNINNSHSTVIATQPDNKTEQPNNTGTENKTVPSINKQVETDIDDRLDLHDAGLSTAQTKPIEKVYNEWITTFSDDSLFDEMTENLNHNENSENTGKSPEQRAAEGLLMLRNQPNDESNETLLPVDAPKLPDLVLEMDAEKVSVNTEKTTEDKILKSKDKDVKETESKNKENKDKEAANREKPAGTTKSPMKGVFQMRTIGLRKHKSTTHRIEKKIGCSMCKQKFDDRKGLKLHHQQDHKIQMCDICGKNFSTKKSLSKHLYKHSDLPWKCKKCGEGYAFPSELRAHLVIHESEPMFKCNIIGCDKEYMRQSELTAHMKTHDGTVHKCPEEGCAYEAIDLRYLKNHMRVHSDDLPYQCKYCDQAFKHFMQRKRHYKNDHP